MVWFFVGTGVVAFVSLLLSMLFAQVQKDALRSFKFDDAKGAAGASGCFSILFFIACLALIVGGLVVAGKAVL